MAYIGKTPVIGNFVKLDAISVVNGQAAYAMNNGGSAFTNYDNVNAPPLIEAGKAVIADKD